MNLNLKNRFVVVVFVLIIFIPLSTADDTNNFKSDNLVNNFKSVTEVTNITNVNINQSVNVSSCNPANQALGNWNGTGWECVSIADDDSGYLTFESDPVAMANISLNFNTWMLWSLDKPNYLLKSELNNTFDRNHANETNLEWSKSGHIIDTNLDMNFYPIYNISEIKPYTSGEFGLYELFDPTFISFIDHQLTLDTDVFQIEPTLVSSFKDLDMNGHNILNSPSLNDNDSQYLNKSDYYNASNDLQTSKDYTNSSNISMKNYVDSTDTALAANDTQDRAYVNTTFIKIANATTCTGTDKSVWNGTSFICSTDQTGSGTGTSFTQYNRTTTDTKFGSLTSYNKTMTISLTANKVISGECLLLVNSSVTTALPNLYFNITGNASGTTNLYYDTDVFTSATASTSAFSTVQNTTLNPTAVLTTPLPYTINWWVNEGASGGNFTIAIKSSVTAGSIVTLNRGSYCRSIEI